MKIKTKKVFGVCFWIISLIYLYDFINSVYIGDTVAIIKNISIMVAFDIVGFLYFIEDRKQK